ncbi:pentatricopeptide repeat-containing protein At2g06000 [Lactuca sativa]|uniref:pentatricopeptide repeat-containing protein At2g06000 n=1 Tax=Lactuca sativa TaxID=4236 RepID=UPI000CC334C4|nr:pentatricopeptide repeat-containing protein At2g06000 [Lactuca sativa]
MPLRLPNHFPRTHIFPIYLFTFSKLQWASKFSSISKCQRQTGGAASVWFVKVVCTLYVRRKSSVTEVRISDYLRKKLDSSIAFTVIEHMNTNWNNPNLAYRFLEYTKVTLNLVHSFETYSFLVRSFCQSGVPDAAKLVIDSMRIDNLSPDSSLLGFVITSFIISGKLEVAMELISDYSQYSSEKDDPLSCFVFNRLLSSLIRINKVDEAVSFFEKVILRSQCYSPDAYTFNIVISGLCKARKVNKAFEFFNQMKEFDCLPDKVTYNTLLDGFFRVGNVKKAHELLQEMLIIDGFSCSPDVVTFTSVIEGYKKLGKMKEALLLFDDMINLGIKPNNFTFNVMIDGFGKIGNMVSLSSFYKKMLDFDCKPDVITFTSIINGHCRIGELSKAFKILDEMSRRNLHPNIRTFSILINALCKEGRLNEAHDLLQELNKRDDIAPKAFIYNPVIDGFCKRGNVDEANVIFKEMEEKKVNPDKLTFTILIIGHCMKGRMVEAISLFEKMVKDECAPDSITVNSLVSRLLKAGMPKEAYEIKKVALGVPLMEKDGFISKNLGIPVAV